MLRAQALCFSRGHRTIIEDLSLAVESGECVFLLGSNGSGKTTLMRLLAGLLEPQGGAVERERALYLGHLSGVKPDLSVEENIRLTAGIMGAPPPADLAGLLAAMGLSAQRHALAGRLSAGQRKRVALTSLLYSDAPLWLLDEPYANLDAAGHELLDAQLARHCRGGGAVVMAHHGAHRPEGLSCRELVL